MWAYFPRSPVLWSRPKEVRTIPASSPTDRPKPPPPELLLKALGRLLRPLVRVLIQSGVTFPVLADLLRGLYVDAARELLPGKREQTDSRISLLTGVHRKEIRRQREADSTQEEPAAVTRTSAIIGRWLGAAAYTDGAAQPLPLPRAGPAPSFDALVESVTRDVRARAVLDELLAQGIVTQTEGGAIALNAQAFLPREGQDAQLFYFARNLHDHIAAAAANIVAPGPAPFLDRSVHYDRLSPEAAAQLLAVGRDAAQATLLNVNRAALGIADADEAARAVGAGSAPTRRVNLGIYLYAEDEPAPRADVPAP